MVTKSSESILERNTSVTNKIENTGLWILDFVFVLSVNSFSVSQFFSVCHFIEILLGSVNKID